MTIDKDEFDPERWEAQKRLIEAMHRSYSRKGSEASDVERFVVDCMMSLKEGNIEAGYEAIYRLALEYVKPLYFTIDEVDVKENSYRRVFSSHPDEMLLTDDRPLPMGPWTQAVVHNKQALFTDKVIESGASIPDTLLILALGCDSAFYCPVVNPFFPADDDDVPGVLSYFGRSDTFNKSMADQVPKFMLQSHIILTMLPVVRELEIAQKE